MNQTAKEKQWKWMMMVFLRRIFCIVSNGDINSNKKYKINKTHVNQRNGDARYRSWYLSHAKRALYHLIYIPFLSQRVIKINKNFKKISSA